MDVSIVIPFFERADLTLRCLRAVRRTVPSEVEILLVDDGSRGAGKLDPGPGARVIRLPENRGFAGAVNCGAAEARGALLVLLNNDTIPRPGWLDALIEAGREPGVGLVGARLIYPGTRLIQHAGVVFGPDRLPYHIYRYHDMDAPHVRRRRRFAALTGACLLVRADLFRQLGGLDEGFRNCYEDVDLCLRAGSRGLLCIYEPAALLEHEESASPGRNAAIAAGKERFLARWGTRIEPDDLAVLREDEKWLGGEDGVGERLPGPGGRTKRRVRLRRCAGRQPHSPLRLAIDGDLAGAHSLAHVNRELGRALAACGVVQAGRPPDVVLRHRFPPDFSSAGGAALVQLIHWEFGAVPRVWVEGLSGADEVWVMSSAVREAFVRGGVPAAKVAVIPGGVAPERFHPGARPLDLPTRKRFRFLFVGPPIRRKGIDLLLAAYRAEFRREDDVCLVIKDSSYYRNLGRDAVRAAAADPAGPEIVFLEGDLPAASMPSLYTACQAYVHPYRGEGFGLPILEAMACGLPVAATGRGACLDYLDESTGFLIEAEESVFPSPRVEQYETVGLPFWAEPRLPAIREVLRRLLADPREARVRAVRGLRRAHEHFTWAAAAARAAARLRAITTRRGWRARALALFVDGSSALEAGRPAEACASLAAALRLEPRFAYGLAEYGVALALAGRPEAARDALRAALVLAPDLAEARGSLEAVEAVLAGEATLPPAGEATRPLAGEVARPLAAKAA